VLSIVSLLLDTNLSANLMVHSTRACALKGKIYVFLSIGIVLGLKDSIGKQMEMEARGGLES